MFKQFLLISGLLGGTLAYWYPEDPWCEGLADHPEPRTEPYNIKFAEELAKEIHIADIEAVGPAYCLHNVAVCQDNALTSFEHQ